MPDPKVLIVDDNRDLGEGLKAVLEDEDYEVTLALTGEEAISLSHEQNFDFTVMDVQLPGINGIEAFMEIRSVRPDTPVIVMSGYRIEQVLAEALNKDNVPVLRKPVANDQVLAALGDMQSAEIVLIVDENPETVSNIELSLKANNYTALIARTEREAMKITRPEEVEILILDLRLPVLKGLEVYIKLQKQGRVIPTILVTGYAPKEAGTDVLHSLSVTGCLFKPFKPEQLLQGLRYLEESAGRS